jgi:hypothetical protein
MSFNQHYMLPIGVDSAPNWSNPSNAYDGSTATYAESSTTGLDWISLTAPADRGYAKYVKIYCAGNNSGSEEAIAAIVEIYHDGVWSEIANGSFTANTWITLYHTSYVIIEKVRMRRILENGVSLRLKEVQVEVQWVTFTDVQGDASKWPNTTNLRDDNFSTYNDSIAGYSYDDASLDYYVPTGFGDIGGFRIKATKPDASAINLSIEDGDLITFFTGSINGLFESQISPVVVAGDFIPYPTNGTDLIRLYEAQICGQYTTPAVQNTISISSSSGGNVTTPGEGDFEYDDEEVVNIVATADTNYHFTEWTGTAVTAGKVADPNDPTTTVTVSEDGYTLIANFAINTYTLTYAAGTHGSIDGTSPQTVDYGEDGTSVEAVPDANYHFVKWSDDSTDNPRQDLNVTANISVTAQFASDNPEQNLPISIFITDEMFI